MINNEEIEESKKNKLQNQNQYQQVEEAEEPQKSTPKNKKEILSGIIPSTKKNMPIFEDPLDSILYNINKYVLLVNKLDHYGNSIPLGAFCFGISFIMIGLFECQAHKDPDKFFYIFLLLFGGCGQVIAGILEYIKGRSFASNLYLIYGIYFISLYLVEYPNNNKKYLPKDCYPFFYGSWAGLTFPLCVSSIKVNVMYVVQTVLGCLFFILRCIGESKNIEKINKYTSGVFELAIGVVSLYICFSQIINETLGFQLLPCIMLQEDNDIDLINNNNEKKEITN